jgi:uncharacterized protein YlxP (DUF503 family)
MVVGVCHIRLAIHDNHSLKGKRHVLKGMMEKVKGRFNVSIAEVGDNDSWGSALIGVSAVGNDRAFVNSVMDKVVNYIEGLHTAEVLDYGMELMNL